MHWPLGNYTINTVTYYQYFQKYLEDPLAEEILNMNVKSGDVMVAEMDETGEKIRFVLKKEEKKKEKKSEA